MIGPAPAFSPTPRQLTVMRFIAGYAEAHGYAPSLREIAQGADLANKSRACDIVARIEERGQLRRLPRRDRAIQLLHPPAIPRAPDGAPLFVVALPGLPHPAEVPHG